MVIYLYYKMVVDFMKDGVNFRDYFYVLERDLCINEFFYEYEDYNYVLK